MPSKRRLLVLQREGVEEVPMLKHHCQSVFSWIGTEVKVKQNDDARE